MSRIRSEERLERLGRPDKWFLTCGDGIIWAPPFPIALHRPGFWDEAHVYYHPFAPLFSVAAVKPDGSEMPLRKSRTRWLPHELVVDWECDFDIALTERRFACHGGRFTSLWSYESRTEREAKMLSEMQLVCYTAQPGETVTWLSRSADGLGVEWQRVLKDRHGESLDVLAHISVEGIVEESQTRCAAIRSEGSAPLPRWDHTPFWDTWRQQEAPGLPDRVQLDGVTSDGLVYAAVQLPLTRCDQSEAGFTIELRAKLSGKAPAPRPYQTEFGAAQGEWLNHFDSYPTFSCSDEFLTRYYDYRLYGLRLNQLGGDCGNVRFPAVAEGIGYFHVPITYSAQCHMWETRWARDPAVAHGSLLNFLEHQRSDGSLHGRIYTNHLKNTDFYHANWGDAVLAVDAIHNDANYAKRCYEGLARYANWLDSTRDRENSGMYDVANHYETGQEYMSRYQAVDARADIAGWQEGLRLKGIDITVYTYQLKRALAKLARKLVLDDDEERWRSETEHIGGAILKEMWDESTGMFSDVDPRTGCRTNVKAAVCFYPLLTDLLSDEIVRRMIDHLSNPEEFATPYPVPSSSLDDQYFNANAEWKGKRHNCPWNGRTWPMTNSHILEGLIRQWHLGRREVGTAAADILTRYVRMMFLDGNLERPNCFEHYNPITGHPSAFRGIDDYQHSWVLDLLIRGVAGLQPESDHILIDPLPIGLPVVRLIGAVVRGRCIDVLKVDDTIQVTIDGASYSTEAGTQLRIPHG